MKELNTKGMLLLANESLRDLLLNGYHGKKPRFTLERGRGETYANGRATLYAHGTYPRGSVLAGRPSRMWLEDWDSWEDAREALKYVKTEFKKFRYEDMGPSGGSSHIPVADMVAHLPDDTDY